MAKAILLPLLKANVFSANEVFAVVGKKSSIETALKDLTPGVNVVSSDDPHASEVWNSNIKILAVKPQQLGKVKLPPKNFLLSTHPSTGLLISLIAGVTLSRLQQFFPGIPCARAVPNLPVLVGSGLTGIAWGADVSSDQRNAVESIFNPISEILTFPEEQLNAFLALTSSGPAYVSLIVEALADGAVAAGLPRDSANYLAHRTLFGTALFLKEKRLHPGELKDMVASPGGTTIAALRHLEKAGLRSALMEAVVLAAQRGKELS